MDFPGYGSVEYTDANGRTVQVDTRLGRVQVPVSKPEVFRKRSLLMRELDREIEEGRVPEGTTLDEYQRLRNERNGKDCGMPKNTSKSNSSKRTTGKRGPAKSKTPQKTKAGSTDQSVERIEALEKQMSQVCQGMERLIGMMAGQHASQQPQEPGEGDATAALQEVDPDQQETWDEDDDDSTDEEESEVASDPIPFPRQTDAEAGLEPGMTEVQELIRRTNPLKTFRHQWKQLCPSAGFLEWQAEDQEKLTSLIDAIATHPKFIHNVRTFVRRSRNGGVVGNAQVARVCSTMAGMLAVYQMAIGSQ